MTLLTIVVLMMVGGVIDAKEALSGFSNRGMITVGLLYLVSEGVSRSGALSRIAALMLPQRKGKLSKMFTQMLVPVSGLSAFLNNTPIVIIFAPMFKRWAETMNVPSQKLLIPLSYATILGGMCTVIGTSTNLVVDGMMMSETGSGMPLFEVGKVGLPITIIGLLYVIFASRYLLPGNPKKEAAHTDIPKEYYYDVTIHPGSKFIGKEICNGQVESLGDMRVTSVLRENAMIHADANTITIIENDKLVLAGTSKGLNRLMMTPDLSLNCLHNCDDSFRETATKQVEAVLAPRFPGIGKTLEEFDFYRHYGAIVMALHRNGQRITHGLNKIKLTEGDNLVLLTDDTFMKAWGESSVFYLLAETDEVQKPVKSHKRTLTLILTAIMILGAAIGENVKLPWNFQVDMFSMAAITAIIMAWTNIFPAKKYTKFVSWDVMITISCAFAISKGMINSGIAAIIAEHTIGAVYQFGPQAVLAVLFLITALFTEVITNNAAAALAFPIALESAKELHADPLPFFITICIAASASFLTPIGYQTNLIVQGIGNYRFSDFMKVGLPLSIIVFIMSVILIPIIWPF